MRQIPAPEVTWPYTAAAALIAIGALIAFEFRSLQTHMWTDEILTVTLAQASSLPKLWSGIAWGIDGNPPLFLTLAWMLVHAAPASVSPVVVLRVANLLLTIAATLILYRLSLRAASRLAAWIGGFLFFALNTNLGVLATELRTYGLYFFTAALAVLLQQRLSERGGLKDAGFLALGYVALTLSHTFGIVYVVCIAVSGLLSQWNRGWSNVRLTFLAAVPALSTFACWIPIFIRQSEVGKPYLWITAPDFGQLVLIMWSTPLSMWIALVELFCLAGVAIGTARADGAARQAMLRDPRWQFARYALAVAVGISGITIVAWTVSMFVFPIFVPRYFVPQVMVSFALHVAFCELILRAIAERLNFRSALAARWAALALPLLFAFVLSQRPSHGQDRCTDSQDAFFEKDFVRGDLPVVADSAHVFMPRSHYSPNGAFYRLPLDWEVVLKYPLRDRGNATDFHVFERLKLWLPMPSIVYTEDIVRNYPEFLVIESDRAWFENLRQTRDVSAEKLAQVETRGGTCTLWKVTSVKPRP